MPELHNFEMPDGSMVALQSSQFKWTTNEEAEAPIAKAGVTIPRGDLKALYAKGAKWITLKETRQSVLIMPFGDHYRVIAGAGGALEHLKMTQVKTPEEFTEQAKIREIEKRKKERARKERLTEAQLVSEREKEKTLKASKKKIRESFRSWVQEKIGVTHVLSDQERKAVRERAKAEAEESPKVQKMESKEKKKHIEKEAMTAEKAAEKIKQDMAKREERETINKAQNIVVSFATKGILEDLEVGGYDTQKEAAEAQAAGREVAMSDTGLPLPEKREEWFVERPTQVKMSYEEAMEILKQDMAYKKAVKKINKEIPKLDAKVFDLETIGVQISDEEVEMNALESHVKLQRALLNHQFYETIAKHRDGGLMERNQSEGGVASLNAISSEILGEALVDRSLLKEVGVSAASQMVAHRIWQRGNHKKVIEALREELITSNIGIVERALKTANEMYERKAAISELSDVYDPRAVSGHNLSNINQAIKHLGTASGSLEAAATVLHALMREPHDEVRIDVGTSALAAERKAAKLGLKRGDYTVDHQPGGRWALKIKASSYDKVLNRSKADAYHEDKVLSAIKNHEKNVEGWRPSGVTEKAKDGTKVRLSDAQQSGIRMVVARMERALVNKEKSGTVLDFRPGTGKTLMAIGMAGEAIEKGMSKRVIISVPGRLTGEFQKELAKWGDGKYNFGIITGETRKKDVKRMVEDPNHHIIVVGHDTLRGRYLEAKEMRKYQRARSSYYRGQGLNPYQATKRAKEDAAAVMEDNTISNALAKSGDFNMVITDEAHEMFTKAAVGAQAGNAEEQKKAKDVSQKREALHKIDAQHKIAMTGTVTRNELDSFMSMTEWAQPGAFNRGDFLDKYGNINQGTTIFQRASVEAFRREVSPMLYTQEIERKGYKVNSETRRMKPSAAQRKHMSKTETDYKADRVHHDTGKRKGAALRRDEQHHRTMHNRDHKTNATVQDIMRTIAKKSYHDRNEAGVFIAYNKHALATLGAAMDEKYGKGSWSRFTGDESPKEREALKDKLNKGEIKFLLGTHGAIATGHNLQAAKYLVNVDLPHTAADLTQRVRRIDRKGQSKDVDVYTYHTDTPVGFRAEDRIDRRKRFLSVFDNPGAFDDTPLARAAKMVRRVKRKAA